MTQQDFHTEVIDRLARIETKQDTTAAQLAVHEARDEVKFAAVEASINSVKKKDWGLIVTLIAASHGVREGGGAILKKILGGGE